MQSPCADPFKSVETVDRALKLVDLLDFIKEDVGLDAGS
jgi:hypothetical protein